jgi:hypothetical protein
MAARGVAVTGLPELQRALRKFAPATQKTFRARLRTIATVVASDAKGNASWSKRIPRAISTTVQAKGAGVRVRAAIAPHGPLYEDPRRRGTFRHPVFGDRGHWVTQTTRPFVQPAVDARQAYIKTEGLRAVQQAKEEAGL